MDLKRLAWEVCSIMKHDPGLALALLSGIAEDNHLGAHELADALQKRLHRFMTPQAQRCTPN